MTPRHVYSMVMAGLVFDPITRDLVLDGDSAKLTEEPTTEILLAIGIEADSFHGDPDQGSRLPALISGPPVVDAARDVEFAAQEALARLEAQGTIKVTRVAFDGQQLDIDTDTAQTTVRLRP